MIVAGDPSMKAKPRVFYTLSVKFVPKEKRFFWTLFDAASMAEGYCLDCGFTTNAVDAIAAARAFLGVRPGTLNLVHSSLANAFYGCHWLGFAYVDFGQSLPEDRAYDIECSHQWDPPPAPPVAEDVRGPVPAGARRGTRSVAPGVEGGTSASSKDKSARRLCSGARAVPATHAFGSLGREGPTPVEAGGEQPCIIADSGYVRGQS